MSAPPTHRLDRRLAGLDQARAVAILAMLAAHFAPGVFAQLPRFEPLHVPTLAFARLATPTFMVVFGVTVGFVYLPPRPGMGRRLLKRAALLLVCAVIVAVPGWVRLAAESPTHVWAWPFAMYSVLLFYALAVAALPAWLALAASADGQPRVTARCVAAGVGLWALGTMGHQLWAQEPPGGPEFARMMLVSGSFAYCQMMGTALLAVPVGAWLRRCWRTWRDRRALATLLVAALGLAAVGGLWGIAAGEYDPDRILSGELRTPPRAWYFLHVGGVGLDLIPALELATRAAGRLRPLAAALARFGQVGPVVYTGHTLVLPGLALADRVVPLHGAVRVAAAVVPFGVFCVVVMAGRRPTSSPASTRSSSAHCLPSR
jgi:hypothetical protein